ncbi:DUF1592 domain-containing protein [Alienimonas chondri]|uniref:DUF1592 domain-containing protein n=1 Tax=Alienimonas chondri TaxID=2681879 RepID=A0ABX1VE65_9PLAN|nr:DUF1592 domain-containing protein [Alienimonas chondri]NNJ25805.1 hypothetical protein [Alienimonas chondri]
MLRRLTLAVVVACGSLASDGERSHAADALAGADLAALRPVLDKFCVDCHSDLYAENEFRLDAEALDLTRDLDAETVAVLTKVHDRLKAGEMPPKEASETPTAAQRGHAVAALAGMLHEASLKRQCEEGRTRLRRMTRGEYEHAVHDLLHIDVPLAGILPGDGVAHGFDRTVDALGTSSVLVNGYLEAADVAVNAAGLIRPQPEPVSERHDYLTHKRYENIRKPGNPVLLVLPDALAAFEPNYSPTELRSFKCEYPGRYRVRISAYAFNHDPAKAEPVVYRTFKGEFRAEDRTKTLVDHFAALPKPIDPPADWAPAPEEFEVSFAEGETLKFVPYDIGYKIRQETPPHSTESAVAIRWVEITGPLTEATPAPSHQALFGDNPVVWTNQEESEGKHWIEKTYAVHSETPKEDARRLLNRLATEAFRRPLRDGELDDLFGLLDERIDGGMTFGEAMKLGAKAILCDPAFLTIGGESGRDADFVPTPEGVEPTPQPLEPHALASRLSFMLWGSLPDAQLRAKADDGSISDPAVYRAEAERLLADPKHVRFNNDFLSQWLDLAWIDASVPDPGLAPEYDEVLHPAMVEETRRTFEYMLEENRPVREVADADWAILNTRLARHYNLDPEALGLPPVGFEKVSLPAGSVRGGFLTQASVAKVTANGTHTSPVLRGQFVMDAILGQPIPPPPPGIPAVEPDVRGAETIREMLAAHRADPACATCHNKMDPAGFAMEQLDVVGTYRERYRLPRGPGERIESQVGNRKIRIFNGLAVDPADVLPDGRAFANLKEFKTLLAADERQLAVSLAEKWLVYGTGEGCGFADRRAVDAIVDEAAAEDYGLRTLLLAAVCSDAFKRR